MPLNKLLGHYVETERDATGVAKGSEFDHSSWRIAFQLLNTFDLLYKSKQAPGKVGDVWKPLLALLRDCGGIFSGGVDI